MSIGDRDRIAEIPPVISSFCEDHAVSVALSVHAAPQIIGIVLRMLEDGIADLRVRDIQPRINVFVDRMEGFKIHGADIGFRFLCRILFSRSCRLFFRLRLCRSFQGLLACRTLKILLRRRRFLL